jgi:hypothetical protein
MLNPAQAAALRAELQNPAQQLVSPGTAGSTTLIVNVDEDGAFVQLSGGWVWLDPQGKVLAQYSNANPFARFKIPIVAIVISGADVVLSLVLALVLLVAGLMVFRQSPKSRPLHRFYAWLKIPVALAGAAGMAWMYGAFVGAFSPPVARGASPGAVVFWMWAAGMGVVGCGYSVAVLLVLRSRRVRGYYNSISGAA